MAVEAVMQQERAAAVPEGVASLVLRAHDSIHGYGGREIIIRLER